MDRLHAFQRLSHHANVAEVDSFTFAMWQAERHSHPPELGKLCDEILSCFETVNHGLHQDHPSDTIEGKADTLQRSLVADVSSILSQGWNHYWHWTSSRKFPATFCSDFAAMLVRIGIAWDAVLAGDIEDIREHVQAEFSAREYAANSDQVGRQRAVGERGRRDV